MTQHTDMGGLVERLGKAVEIDAATASDREWTDLLAAAIDVHAALSAGPSEEQVERAARAIAAELGMQDRGAPFPLGEDLTLAYLDQGEVDLAAVARAALTSARAQ